MGVGEDAPPGAADIDRDDRVVGALDDALEAAPEFAQHAVAGERPLGEDADQVAVVQSLPGLAMNSSSPFLPSLDETGITPISRQSCLSSGVL